MKKKALVMALLCVMGLTTLAVGTAGAAYGTFTCTVNKVTANYWGYYLVTLTDNAGSFSNNTMVIVTPGSTEMVKAQFAAALTAFANSTNVVIGGDPNYFGTGAGGIFELSAAK